MMMPRARHIHTAPRDFGHTLSLTHIAPLGVKGKITWYVSTMQRFRCAAPKCTKYLPSDHTPNQKYHDEACRKREQERRYRAKKTAQREVHGIADALGSTDQKVREVLDGAARRGPAFKALLQPENRFILDPVLSGDMNFDVAGQLLGYDRSTISRALMGIRDMLADKEKASNWAMTATNIMLLGPPEEEVEAALEDDDPEAFETILNELVDAWVEWRDRMMTDERGKKYITKPYHRSWIKAILRAILTGKRLMVLSPPRHGKTQLLIDFCIWLMLRNPNVRILWIASNGDLVADWIASMEDQLENNGTLREAYLPPGQDFKPQRNTGKSWSRTQFTVATRTITGIKSPTMNGVGRGGRILSRDVDFMIIDDIEDDSSTIQPKAREDTRKWFAQTAGSRKQKQTGVVVIGSRQHPDDLYGYLFDNPEWPSIIEEAHSSACEKEPLNETIHEDCMLFPEVNDYEWYMSQKRSFAVTGGDSLFLMVYQNVATAEGLMIFDPEAMRACRSERDIGEYPQGLDLVAGLDPAISGYQAAVLWGYQRWTGRLYLIDIDNTGGAGIPGWRLLVEDWLQKYNLRHWVVEDTAAQRGYMQDAWIVNFKNENGIHIEGHHTGRNKWDKRVGVTALSALFRDFVTFKDPHNNQEVTLRKVDLPYGTPVAKSRTDLYIAQAVHFAQMANRPAGGLAGYKSDVVMASWFPMKAIRRWVTDDQSEIEYEYDPTFGGLGRTFDYNEPPWRKVSA